MSFLPKLAAWLVKRDERKRQRRYDEGWSWAAGQLLNGADPLDVQMQVDCGAFAHLECAMERAFDKGAHDACVRWITIRCNGPRLSR